MIRGLAQTTLSTFIVLHKKAPGAPPKRSSNMKGKAIEELKPPGSSINQRRLIVNKNKSKPTRINGFLLTVKATIFIV